MNDGLIDISPALRMPMPIWPTNPGFSIRVVRSVAEGAHSTLSEITMGTHTGTHVDAPAHFIAGERGLDQMALSALVGPARVIEIDAEREIEVSHLTPHAIAEGERLLLKTRNSRLWTLDEFSEDFVYLSTAAAEYLAARSLACLGVDYLSVGGRSNGTEVHRALLASGALLVEGLDLSGAEPGQYDFVCLPLSLAGAEAAPARAVLRPVRG